MTRTFRFLATIFVVSLVPSLATAADLLPPQVIAQLGLEQAWKRHISVPAGAQSIADQQIFVHSESPNEYLEIEVPVPADVPGVQPGETRVLMRIKINQMGTDGKPIVKAEAQRLVDNEVRKLKRRGYEPAVKSTIVPRVVLYSLADDGTIESRNAETGELNWVAQVGDRNLHYGAIGIDEQYLTIVNGPNMYQLDINNGEDLNQTRLLSVPLFGAIHAGRYSMTPTVREGIQSNRLYDLDLDPYMEIVNGLTLAMPVKSPNSERIAWGTDKGFVYVMEGGGEPRVLFRLDTDGIVSGRLAAADGDRFFFASEGGKVYGMRAAGFGEVLWSRPFGEPFYNGPLVVGEQVLIRSTYGNLFSLGTADGLGTWNDKVTSVDELIGVLGDNLFIQTLSGSMAVLDLKTGERLHSLGQIQPGRKLLNTKTDRLYFVGSSGSVQCLRLQGAEHPTFAKQPDIAPQEDTAEPLKPVEPNKVNPFNKPPPADDNKNPFGAPDDNNNPFGAPMGDDDNPFGGNNPF